MITVNNLDFGYYKWKLNLQNLSLQLPEGHIYGLLGKNGVGKSTLLKLLTGALRPNKGNCLIDGENVTERPAGLLERIRLVPENEPICNVRIGELAEVMSGLYPTFNHELFQRALSEFEVPAMQRMTSMSLGQQKKANIALALACGTPYLLMDEPTNGMDIPSKSTFRRIVADAIASNADPATGHNNQTVIISTHQVDDLESLIDAVIIMENDAVLLASTLEEIGCRLCFGIAEPGDEVLYTEPTLHGNMSVMRNTSGVEMPVDVKLLFTAVVKNPAPFKEIFSK